MASPRLRCHAASVAFTVLTITIVLSLVVDHQESLFFARQTLLAPPRATKFGDGTDVTNPSTSSTASHTSVSSPQDKSFYHESFVHPAFVASSLPAKRVLVIGGGSGIVREALKWEAVQQVVVVHADEDDVHESLRGLSPSLTNNCDGFATTKCLEDPRVSLQAEPLDKWLLETFGENMCKHREENKGRSFDVILLSWPNVQYMYSEDTDALFGNLACALGKFGVLATSFGRAPSPSYIMSSEDANAAEDFANRLELIQDMSEYFWHKRVYDISLEDSSLWCFAVGMVPKSTRDFNNDVDLIRGVFNGSTNGGVNDFDGRPARVNLKVRRGLKNGAALSFYDGVMQHGFRFPRARWEEVYCNNPENESICGIEKVLSKDYEDDLYEFHVDGEGGGKSGIVAKRDIKKGTVTGLEDAARDLSFPSTDLYMSLNKIKDIDENSRFYDFHQWVDFYGYDSGWSGYAGELVEVGLSYQSFVNHDCDGNANTADFVEIYPWAEVIWNRWDPVSSRISYELDHANIAARDIKKGEMITGNYGTFSGFIGFTEFDECHDDGSCNKKWLEKLCNGNLSYARHSSGSSSDDRK